jgi:hypothetical protein
VIMGRAQHSAGRDLLDSVRKGDLPGIGTVIIDGLIRIGHSRNTPPATIVPEIEKTDQKSPVVKGAIVTSHLTQAWLLLLHPITNINRK